MFGERRPYADRARRLRRTGDARGGFRRARRGRRRVAHARRDGGAPAQLRRHDRLPARRLRRDVAAGSSLRSRRGVRQARQPRRSRARGDPQPRRGTLLLPGREARARRAADVPQRVPVAVAAAAEGARRFLRFPQGRDRCASPASTRRRGCSSRRTACATVTSSGPTSQPGSSSRRAWSTRTTACSSSSCSAK